MIRAVVAGSAGAMGRLLVDHLLAEKVRLTGIDQKPHAPNNQFTSLQSDITGASAEVKSAIAGADCVLLCLPEEVAIASVPVLRQTMAAGALLVETLSVKLPFAHHAATFGEQIEVLGINPMFAPDLGFAGQKVAVVKTRSGPRTEWFLKMMSRWGAETSLVTAEEHDRIAADVQGLTHAAILAFGLALSKLQYTPESAARMLTPPHRTLLSLLARIVLGEPQVYWDVQKSNVMSEDARRALAASVEEIKAIIESGDRERFIAVFQEIGRMLQPDLAALGSNAAELFRAQMPAKGHAKPA
jgi:4-amino-4-deoxyprephenate dehydrogenase